MKHVTYAQKSLLFGDEAADLLLEYAASLAAANSADTVNIRAFGIDGGEVVATFVLSDGIDLMAETTNSPLPEPDNSKAIEHMQRQMATIKPDNAGARPIPSEPTDFGFVDEL